MRAYVRPRMSRAVLWRVLGRTLFLQTCWNFQKMQNLGFAYALTPVLKVVYPSRATRAKALKRHLEFFVTHPYCASIILGVVAKLEEQVTSNGTYDSTDANRIKVGMMGPLAALGDTLFWATLRPMLALLGSAWVLIAFVVGGEWLWLGPVLFFSLYTLFHLNVRIGGLWLGYARGVEVVKDLRQLNPQRVSQQLGLFASMAAGVLAAAFFQLRTQPIAWAGWNSLNTALLALLGLLFVVGLRRGWSVSRLIYLLVVLAVLAAYLFNLG